MKEPQTLTLTYDSVATTTFNSSESQIATQNDVGARATAAGQILTINMDDVDSSIEIDYVRTLTLTVRRMARPTGHPRFVRNEVQNTISFGGGGAPDNINTDIYKSNDSSFTDISFGFNVFSHSMVPYLNDMTVKTTIVAFAGTAYIDFDYLKVDVEYVPKISAYDSTVSRVTTRNGTIALKEGTVILD